MSDRRRPRPLHRAGALAIAAALLLGAGACGGDDGGDTSASEPAASEAAPPKQAPPPATKAGAESDERLIRAAIASALASGDPAKACAGSVTEAYVVDSYGDRVGCEAAIAAGGAARSVKVSAIAVRGDRATAVAVPTGGPSSGERLDVSLVREGDAWKVDMLRSNVPVGP